MEYDDISRVITLLENKLNENIFDLNTTMFETDKSTDKNLWLANNKKNISESSNKYTTINNTPISHKNLSTVISPTFPHSIDFDSSNNTNSLLSLCSITNDNIKVKTETFDPNNNILSELERTIGKL
jgi:hypothetical protein